MLCLTSMNRAIAIVLSCLLSPCGSVVAQAPQVDPVKDAQASAVKRVVDGMVAAEKALSSLRMTMSTKAKVPGGLEVSTRGVLRVLRGTQSNVGDRLYSRLEYNFGKGLRGLMETGQSKDGIVIFEENPAFGAVFLRLSPELVMDLEWAAAVMKRSDLPGMVDARAQSPLGSGMILDLLRTFDLEVDESGEHEGQKGTWLRGKRKADLDDQSPDLPLSDRVDVFVRKRDRALLLARFYAGEDATQEILVEKLEVGVELTDADFTVDGHGERIRDVKEYAPMYTQVQDAIEAAESKAKDGQVRPSNRGSKPGKKASTGGGK
jgi:hypothetical protein